MRSNRHWDWRKLEWTNLPEAIHHICFSSYCVLSPPQINGYIDVERCFLSADTALKIILSGIFYFFKLFWFPWGLLRIAGWILLVFFFCFSFLSIASESFGKTFDPFELFRMFKDCQLASFGVSPLIPAHWICIQLICVFEFLFQSIFIGAILEGPLGSDRFRFGAITQRNHFGFWGVLFRYFCNFAFTPLQINTDVNADMKESTTQKITKNL